MDCNIDKVIGYSSCDWYYTSIIKLLNKIASPGFKKGGIDIDEILRKLFLKE